MKFKAEEVNLICICKSKTTTRLDMLSQISQMCNLMQKDDPELLILANAVVHKLENMSDREFGSCQGELLLEYGDYNNSEE